MRALFIITLLTASSFLLLLTPFVWISCPLTLHPQYLGGVSLNDLWTLDFYVRPDHPELCVWLVGGAPDLPDQLLHAPLLR